MGSIWEEEKIGKLDQQHCPRESKGVRSCGPPYVSPGIVGRGTRISKVERERGRESWLEIVVAVAAAAVVGLSVGVDHVLASCFLGSPSDLLAIFLS